MAAVSCEVKADVTQSCPVMDLKYLLQLPGSGTAPSTVTVTVDQQLANQTSSPCIETEKPLSASVNASIKQYLYSRASRL